MSTIGPTQRTAVIAGATGFVGSALTNLLESDGYTVIELVRSAPTSENQVRWNPQAGEIDDSVIASADAVITLAGASIAGGWWTSKRKHLILQSRIDTTTTLANSIARAVRKPDVFISTSAVGYYGDRPGEVLDETSSRGDGFLAEVCEGWESAAEAAGAAGVRVVHPRFGLVLDGGGGMLPIIRKPFQFGIGGKIGGDQFMSWVNLQDLVRMFPFFIEHPEIEGPVNAVAPNPVTNAAFTKAMGEVLHRPTVIPVPKVLAGTLGGELVQQLLLADQQVVPQVMSNAGFVFDRPTIGSSLHAAFDKTK